MKLFANIQLKVKDFFFIEEWVTEPQNKMLISLELNLEDTSNRCDNFYIYKREKWQSGTLSRS